MNKKKPLRSQHNSANQKMARKQRKTSHQDFTPSKPIYSVNWSEWIQVSVANYVNPSVSGRLSSSVPAGTYVALLKQ